MKYRILRPSDLVRLGDERWDFQFGWTQVRDTHLERFSKEYRRAGKDAWQFRRPIVKKATGNVESREKGGSRGSKNFP